MQLLQVPYMLSSDSCGRCLSEYASNALEECINEVFDSANTVFIPSFPSVSVQQTTVIIPLSILWEEQNRNEDCTHETVAERALTGTWVLDEIRATVEKGYILVEVQ